MSAQNHADLGGSPSTGPSTSKRAISTISIAREQSTQHPDLRWSVVQPKAKKVQMKKDDRLQKKFDQPKVFYKIDQSPVFEDTPHDTAREPLSFALNSQAKLQPLQQKQDLFTARPRPGVLSFETATRESKENKPARWTRPHSKEKWKKGQSLPKDRDEKGHMKPHTYSVPRPPRKRGLDRIVAAYQQANKYAARKRADSFLDEMSTLLSGDDTEDTSPWKKEEVGPLPPSGSKRKALEEQPYGPRKRARGDTPTAFQTSPPSLSVIGLGQSQAKTAQQEPASAMISHNKAMSSEHAAGGHVSPLTRGQQKIVRKYNEERPDATTLEIIGSQPPSPTKQQAVSPAMAPVPTPGPQRSWAMTTVPDDQTLELLHTAINHHTNDVRASALAEPWETLNDLELEHLLRLKDHERLASRLAIEFQKVEVISQKLQAMNNELKQSSAALTWRTVMFRGYLMQVDSANGLSR